MAYKDAIAGFAQLHQAFRENSTLKYEMMEKQIDRDAKVLEADKSREFMGEEGDKDRDTRIKAQRISSGPGYMMAKLAQEKYDFFKETDLDIKEASVATSEANVRTLNQAFGLKAAGYLRDEAWRKDSAQIGVNAGLNIKDNLDRSIIIAMRAAGEGGGSQILANYMAAKTRAEKIKVATKSLMDKPLLQQFFHSSSPEERSKILLSKTFQYFFGDSDLEALSDLAALGQVSSSQVINQSNIGQNNINRNRYLMRFGAGLTD